MLDYSCCGGPRDLPAGFGGLGKKQDREDRMEWGTAPTPHIQLVKTIVGSLVESFAERLGVEFGRVGGCWFEMMAGGGLMCVG